MKNFIKNAALSLNFDACGIAKAEELTDDAEFLKKWLSAGNNGDMSYLERNFEKRTDPRKLVPGCKSIVVVLLNYFPAEFQLSDAPQIAKYAYSETDYHQVIKLKLKQLENLICAEYGKDCISSDSQHSFVDSAPVLERRWAQRAGLGWIGKHTQLIHPGLGSFVFIGVLMLNVELYEYDQAIKPRCGTCTKCIDACPTNALQNGSLIAKRCISYLTIETKSDIPAIFHKQLSNCAVGCDICATVCPWNAKWAKSYNHIELKPVKELLGWTLAEWNGLTKEKFSSVFSSSAIKRAGFEKLQKNILLIKDSVL